jgi:hypothetical protein
MVMGALMNVTFPVVMARKCVEGNSNQCRRFHTPMAIPEVGQRNGVVVKKLVKRSLNVCYWPKFAQYKGRADCAFVMKSVTLGPRVGVLKVRILGGCDEGMLLVRGGV